MCAWMTEGVFLILKLIFQYFVDLSFMFQKFLPFFIIIFVLWLQNLIHIPWHTTATALKVFEILGILNKLNS